MSLGEEEIHVVFHANNNLCYTAFDSRGNYLPSSSTSAGAVPAFLASSSSFLFRQSSLESFCPAEEVVAAIIYRVVVELSLC